MLHIAPTVNKISNKTNRVEVRVPRDEPHTHRELEETEESFPKRGSSAGIIFKKHKSSSKMSVFVTLIRISPDVRSNQCRNPGHSKGLQTFLLYCSDCCTVIYTFEELMT